MPGFDRNSSGWCDCVYLYLFPFLTYLLRSQRRERMQEKAINL